MSTTLNATTRSDLLDLKDRWFVQAHHVNAAYDILGRYQELEEEIESLLDDLEQEEKDYDLLYSQLGERDRKIDQLKVELMKARGDNAELTASNSILKDIERKATQWHSDLAIAQAEHERLSGELDAMKSLAAWRGMMLDRVREALTGEAASAA